MKAFPLSLRSQNGFTLVELMVVVAIIGLLSAVAIPNFQKYQARSKTAEAKLQLSAIYTAEASFFADYNIYATCLNYMGYNPAEEANSRYYTTGFNSGSNIDATAYASATNAGINTTQCPSAFTTGNGSTHFLAAKALGAQIATAAFLATTANGTQADTGTMNYLAGAAGIVHKAYTANNTGLAASYFTINQFKRISTVQNGF